VRQGLFTLAKLGVDAADSEHKHIRESQLLRKNGYNVEVQMYFIHSSEAIAEQAPGFYQMHF
jgi:hypothetical protein